MNQPQTFPLVKDDNYLDTAYYPHLLKAGYRCYIGSCIGACEGTVCARCGKGVESTGYMILIAPDGTEIKIGHNCFRKIRMELQEALSHREAEKCDDCGGRKNQPVGHYGFCDKKYAARQARYVAKTESWAHLPEEVSIA